MKYIHIITISLLILNVGLVSFLKQITVNMINRCGVLFYIAE